MNKMVLGRKCIVLGFLCFLIWSPSRLLAGEIPNDECLSCHTDLNHDKFLSSVHGKNLCTSCHSDIKETPHEDKLLPVNCANCHHLEAEIYRNSDHGKALHAGATAASCLSCHG